MRILPVEMFRNCASVYKIFTHSQQKCGIVFLKGAVL